MLSKMALQTNNFCLWEGVLQVINPPEITVGTDEEHEMYSGKVEEIKTYS